MAESPKSDVQKIVLSSVVAVSNHNIISICYEDEILLAGCDAGLLTLWRDVTEGGKMESLYLGVKDPINCIRCISDHQWLVGCGDTMMLVTLVAGCLQKVNALVMPDEINSIDVNEKRTYAGIGDDSGHLTTVDLKTYKVHKRLLKHDNICSCVKFRPKSPWSIVTAGLDCMLHLWNFNKGQVLGSVNMADVKKEEEKSSYVVNPPLIHSLALSSDGLIAAAGLENGKIHLYTIGGKGFKFSSLLDAHTRGVSGLTITPDSKLVSAGNDCQLNVWKISTARAPGKTLVWLVPQHTTLHTEKPSSVAVFAQKNRLIVADETDKITLYNWLTS
ncbi:WD repeat-containing protein 53-like [Watersipora subatra]|uniref:WD repeat-containing protein 53-like n=1 Tax=Watersipora subatra TaxID=2589382 RepID=UPI00355BA0B9